MIRLPPYVYEGISLQGQLTYINTVLASLIVTKNKFSETPEEGRNESVWKWYDMQIEELLTLREALHKEIARNNLLIRNN